MQYLSHSITISTPTKRIHLIIYKWVSNTESPDCWNPAKTSNAWLSLFLTYPTAQIHYLCSQSKNITPSLLLDGARLDLIIIVQHARLLAAVSSPLRERDQKRLVAGAKKVPDSEQREALRLISDTERKWPAFGLPLNPPYMTLWGLPEGYCCSLCPDHWETESFSLSLMSSECWKMNFHSNAVRELKNSRTRSNVWTLVVYAAVTAMNLQLSLYHTMLWRTGALERLLNMWGKWLFRNIGYKLNHENAANSWNGLKCDELRHDMLT